MQRNKLNSDNLAFPYYKTMLFEMVGYIESLKEGDWCLHETSLIKMFSSDNITIVDKSTVVYFCGKSSRNFTKLIINVFIFHSVPLFYPSPSGKISCVKECFVFYLSIYWTPKFSTEKFYAKPFTLNEKYHYFETNEKTGTIWSSW